MKWFYFPILIAALYIFGFQVFVNYLPKRAPLGLPQSEVALVFTGSSGRIEAGFDLLQIGWQGEMLITSLYKDTTLEDLSGFNQLSKEKQNLIDVDYLAQNTRDNARASKAWLADKDTDSVVLITAFYHQPRSQKLLKKQMPGLRVEAWPVFASPPPSHLDLLREYNKFIAMHLRLL